MSWGKIGWKRRFFCDPLGMESERKWRPQQGVPAGVGGLGQSNK